MLPLLFVPASRQKPHQVQQFLYLSAITGGPVITCRCPLNGTFTFRLSRSNRVSNASPKPSSICACTSLSVSELLHKVNLYHSPCCRSMTSTASQPASKKSSGDFPVVRCTHVLSSSMSFPYGKIVTHFRWFVNGEFRYCITFSSACTSTATPSGTQWLSASFLLPCSPQKGSYRSVFLEFCPVLHQHPVHCPVKCCSRNQRNCRRNQKYSYRRFMNSCHTFCIQSNSYC